MIVSRSCLKRPKKKKKKLTYDRARHDPMGLTGPENLNTNKQYT